MMNNKIKRFSKIFLLVFTLLFIVVCVGACSEHHVHTFEETWTSDETYHWHAATCDHKDEKKDYEKHTFVDGKCTTCLREEQSAEPHEHSFSETWTQTETHHWHASTCGHPDAKKDYGEHTFVNGVCSECQYQQGSVVPPVHEHTYSDKWTTNEVYHWRAAICEHPNERTDFGEHQFENNRCKICGYEQPDEPVVTFNVTFNPDGGTMKDEQTIKVVKGQKVVKPNDPIKVGYRFIYWETEDGKEFNFDTPINDNITLRASYDEETRKYKVTFNSSGGSDVAAIEGILYNATITAPTPPTKPNNIFAGWYLEGNPFDFSTPITANITLVARWTIKKVTVNFDSQGGDIIVSQTIDSGTTAKEPTPPTKTDADFVGWLLNGEPFDFSTPVTDDITLVADWDEYVSITFSNPEGSYSWQKSNTYKIKEGENVKSFYESNNDLLNPDPGFSHSHFVFIGWFIGEEEFDPNQTFTASTTIVAKWEKWFEVTFANADLDIPVQVIKEGEYATSPGTDFTDNAGHPMDNWYYNGSVFDFSKTAITNNTTVFARYQYYLSFNTDGGSEIERQLIPYGKSGQEPTPPTKDHYYFLGWYHSGSEYIFDAETITEDITVTARWAYTFHGLGTIENPFLLETKDDVEMFSSLINEDSTNPVNGEPYYFAHYRLANDIDMLDGEIEPLLNFQGTFDGNNKTIKNLVLKTGSLENTGFFGSVIGTKDETSGLIKNFTLDNVQISGERANNANIGLLVGYAYGATIVGCKATGTITLNKNRMEKAVIGGLVGRANYSLINATFVEVDILGGDVVGGIAGYITEETVVSSSYVAQGSTIQLYRGGSLSGLVGNVDSGCIVVSSLTLATLKNSDYTTSNLSKQFKLGDGEGSFVNCYSTNVEWDKLAWNSQDWDTTKDVPTLKTYQLEHNKVKLTVKDPKGGADKVTEYEYGSLISQLPPVEGEAGYTFVGYKFNDSIFDFSTPLYGDIVLTPYYDSFEKMLGTWYEGEDQWISINVTENKEFDIKASLFTGEYDTTGSNFRVFNMQYVSSSYETLPYMYYDSYGDGYYSGYYYDGIVIYLNAISDVQGAEPVQYRVYVQRIKQDTFDIGFLTIQIFDNAEWVTDIDMLLPNKSPYSGYYVSDDGSILYLKSPYFPNFNNYNQQPFYDAATDQNILEYSPFIVFGLEGYSDGTIGFTLANDGSAIASFIADTNDHLQIISSVSESDFPVGKEYFESYDYLNSRWFNEDQMLDDSYEAVDDLNLKPKDPIHVFEYENHNHVIYMNVSESKITIDGHTYTYTVSINSEGVEVLSYTDSNNISHRLWPDYQRNGYEGVAFNVIHEYDYTPDGATQPVPLRETWTRFHSIMVSTWVEDQPDYSEDIDPRLGNINLRPYVIEVNGQAYDYDYVDILNNDGIKGMEQTIFEYLRFVIDGKTYYLREYDSIGWTMFYFEDPNNQGHILDQVYVKESSFEYDYRTYEGNWMTDSNDGIKELLVKNEDHTINGVPFEYGWHDPIEEDYVSNPNANYYDFITKFEIDNIKYQFRAAFIRPGIGYLYKYDTDSDKYLYVATYYNRSILDNLIGTWYYYDYNGRTTIQVGFDDGYTVRYNGKVQNPYLTYNGYNSSPVIAFDIDDGEKVEKLHLIYSYEYGYELMYVYDYNSYDAYYDEDEGDYTYGYGTEYLYFKSTTIDAVVNQMSGVWTDGTVTATITGDEIIVSEPGYETAHLSIAYIYDLPSAFMDQYVIIMVGMDASGNATHMLYYYNYYMSVTHFLDDESSTGYNLIDRDDIMVFRGEFETSHLNENHNISFDGTTLYIDGEVCGCTMMRGLPEPEAVEYTYEYRYATSLDGKTVVPVLTFSGIIELNIDDYTVVIREGTIYYENGTISLYITDTTYKVTSDLYIGDEISIENLFDNEIFYNSDIIRYNGIYEFRNTNGETQYLALNDGAVFVNGVLLNDAEVTTLGSGALQVVYELDGVKYYTVINIDPYGELLYKTYQLIEA